MTSSGRLIKDFEARLIGSEAYLSVHMRGGTDANDGGTIRLKAIPNRER